MDHCPPKEFLFALLANRIPESQSQLLNEHLSTCESCRLRANELSDDGTMREIYEDHARMSQTGADWLGDLRDRMYAMADRPTDRASPRAHVTHPPKLGRYQLHEVLGVGTFGVVYRADDVQLGRPVALKLPRSSVLVDPEGHKRFLREARAVASLHHPQIVALYDAGECDGICYLASALTPGQTLGQWMVERNGTDVDADEAARIILALAEAVQHAHDNGVLHRDIKPQNVLLDPTASFAGLTFVPKLTDFGVAKITHAEFDQTATGHLVGTPRYMAPEQVVGSSAIGPACDVYALGVLLFELLTGRAPIEGTTQADTLRRILSDEPMRPRRLRPNLTRDLEAICLTCLEKKPQRRYASAHDLASDLQRYLDRQPTQARPLRGTEKAARWVRRQPAMAGLISVCIAATLLLLVGLWIHNRRLDAVNTELTGAVERAGRASRTAQQSQRRAEELLYVSDMRLAGRAWRDGDMRELATLLRRHQPTEGQLDRRGFEWHFLHRIAETRSSLLGDFDGAIYFIQQDAAGERLAVVGEKGSVRLLRLADGEELLQFAAGQGELNGFDFSPDGTRWVTAGDDGTVRIWNSAEHTEPLLSFKAAARHVFQARYALDGRILATCGNDPHIQLWDAQSGRHLAELPGHAEGVESIAISADGKRLVSAGRGGIACLWDLAEQKELLRVSSNPTPVNCFTGVALSPDGRWFATVDDHRQILIWNASTGRQLGAAEHLDALFSLDISPDGRYVIAGDMLGVLSFWELEFAGSDEPESVSIKLVRQWRGHESKIDSLRFTPDDQVVSASRDGTVKAWSIRQFTEKHVLRSARGALSDPHFASAVRLIAKDDDHQIWHSDVREGSTDLLLQELPLIGARISAGPQASLLASFAKPDGLLQVYDLKSGEVCQQWEPDPGEHWGEFSMSLDGRNLAAHSFSADKARVRVFDTSSGEVKATFESQGTAIAITLSPDGRQLAFSTNTDLLLWDGSDAMPRRIPRIHASEITHLAFNKQGTQLASAGQDRLVHIWDTRNGQRINTLTGHRDAIRATIFSSDGRSLISSSADGTLKVWHLATGQELFDLHDDSAGFHEMVLSPDGRSLAVIAGADCHLLLFDLPGH